jgi:hypothetical protein
MNPSDDMPTTLAWPDASHGPPHGQRGDSRASERLTRSRAKRSYRRVGGVALPKDMDGRSAMGRRFRELVRHYVGILGDERPGEADASLIRRCAYQALQLEQLDADRLAGKQVSGDEYIRLSGELRRGEATLGRFGGEA